MKNKLCIISGLIALFITLPLWLYLFYSVLKAVNATELMWFLYWVYAPVSLFAGVLAKIVGDD